MSSNFDIYSIINKSDAKDRATIFFDQLLSMSILNKAKFSDAEIEALSNSFKSNSDANLYNAYLHNSVYSLFLIAEIEKEIAKIEYLRTYLRFYHLSKDDQLMMNYLLADASKKLQKSKNNSDKKEIKNTFAELSKNIHEFCFLSFGEKVIEKFTTNRSELADKEDLEDTDSDCREELFIKFFTDSISIKTQIAKKILDQLKTKYDEFEVKFEVVEDKIKEFENKLENYKTFEDKLMRK